MKRGSSHPNYKQKTTFLGGLCSQLRRRKTRYGCSRLAKNWSSYNLTIYTDGTATNSTAIGGGGNLFTAGHPGNPTIHRSYAIPTGTWCSSFQAEMKAIKKALQIIHTEESPQKVQMVSNSQSVLLRIANLQPTLSLKSADESDIINLHAALDEDDQQPQM